MTQTISQATIYLSGQRGCTLSRGFRSFHSFNFGSYQNDNRKPFGSLRAFNDDTLGEKSTVTHTISEDMLILLVPVVGGIEIQVKDGATFFLDAGESNLISLTKGSTLKITNPHSDELVNFINVWFTPDQITPGINIESVFELDDKRNTLIHLFSFRNLEGYLGKFSGRKDSTYHLQNYSGSVFAFVVEGAFEFQSRLLEQRDGLLISNVQSVDFEALSNDAILLVLEI